MELFLSTLMAALHPEVWLIVLCHFTGAIMSLNVSSELLARAEAGAVEAGEFLECIKSSLPRAWAIVDETVQAALTQRAVIIFDDSKRADDETRGEILRMFASDAMRSAIQQYVQEKLQDADARIAFQNCHKVGVFPGTDAGAATLRDFISPRGQILGQRPELLHC